MLVLAIRRSTESFQRSFRRSFSFRAECFYAEGFCAEPTDEQESDCVKSLGTIARRALASAALLLGLVYAGDY